MLSERIQTQKVTKILYRNIHSRIIHNNQKVEKKTPLNCPSTDEWISKMYGIPIQWNFIQP